MHKNVRQMLIYSALYGAATGVAIFGVLDAYLFIEARESNKAVGWAESVSGLTQVLVAFPAGYLVDKVARSRVLIYCALFSFIYVITFVVGVVVDDISIIYLGLILQGIYSAISNTATYSLYSDSVSCGEERTQALSRVAIVTQVSMASGPLVAVILFRFIGDVWSLDILRGVLICGLLLMLPANLFLFGWADPHPTEKQTTAEGGSEDGRDKRISSVVPYMVCINDVITCVGAGMTVKFFPLFFKNDYSLSPVQVQLLFAGYLCSLGVFTFLCERVSRVIGRVQASLIFSLAGTACLFLLAKIQNLPIVILVFVLRGAFQNAIYPIDRSIIMDAVPSDQRGRWNAFESIANMTWSGSAVLGGYLIQS